jgi:hypothetical protein
MKLHAHRLVANLLLPWTTQKTPLESSEEKLLARRFRNLNESFDATTTTTGMKEKKDMWRNCSSLKSLTFKDHVCFRKNEKQDKDREEVERKVRVADQT